jgi:hypothetical protein
MAQKREPNYRALFVIGLSFLGAGISLSAAGLTSTGIALTGVGVVFIVVGVSNRKKWGIPKNYARGEEAGDERK